MAEITMYDVEVETTVDLENVDINVADLEYVDAADIATICEGNSDAAMEFFEADVQTAIDNSCATPLVQAVLNRLMDLLGAGVISPEHLPEQEQQDPSIEDAIDILAAALKDTLVKTQTDNMKAELSVVTNN